MTKRDDELIKWYQKYHPFYDPTKSRNRKGRDIFSSIVQSFDTRSRHEKQISTAIIKSSKTKDAPQNSNKANVSALQGLRVFLCYASSDKQSVRKLYNHLLEAGADPWLDEEKILPGQDWDQEISKAVRNSHIILICLSNKSINKVGYVQKEIKRALDVADEQPEDRIFLIPVKLEECDVPERLRQWQWVNLFDKSGWKKLITALEHCANSLSMN